MAASSPLVLFWLARRRFSPLILSLLLVSCCFLYGFFLLFRIVCLCVSDQRFRVVVVMPCFGFVNPKGFGSFNPKGLFGFFAIR